jgi:hypothetical protein
VIFTQGGLLFEVATLDQGGSQFGIGKVAKSGRPKREAGAGEESRTALIGNCKAEIKNEESLKPQLAIRASVMAAAEESPRVSDSNSAVKEKADESPINAGSNPNRIDSQG